ncbi:hypothetical protein TREMEDRAFT_58649 [Tremella mesenterica DSM 1558]|uniref:uncharacterized protein n=1 Tax=Tremella mesenterica (strain ATCC 24925 / CBS 8224 / DSM 1558 / NBRC 9311 / NRRL Y-6157 / RJB 2259-6 / UBC 559-6) TaxID=578456 RepID=UPI0003F49A91|nr:uncharacterized protein TREMEDRAFT_58649 [Tremella mesenterica DSM 1558]EIW72479.1 hypothetical protein TREMEDRAFT_58649 [Tremella mesenterica DSM 1558]
MSTFMNISNQSDMNQKNHIRSCASFFALSCLTCGNQVRGDHWHHGLGSPGDTVLCCGPCAWSHMQDAMSVGTASVEVKEQGAELEEDGEEEGFNDDTVSGDSAGLKRKKWERRNRIITPRSDQVPDGRERFEMQISMHQV